MCSVRTVKDVISTYLNYLACPEGVEPTTYGLEGLKNLGTQCSTMVYSALVLGVSFGSDFVASPGVSCGDLGIHRHVSGKPTFHKRHYKKTATMKVAAITSETHA